MVKITFGMIVLNGEPFIKYNLQNIYPYAHQIIIVEGAALGAASIALENGHSRDTTLATVEKFIQNCDPENKITFITAEDEGYSDGFWPGEKDEQSKAYAKRATGQYLWQIDADEFYKPEDIEKVIALIENNPTITSISFKTITFWGGLDYYCDGWHLRQGAEIFHRLFKWGNNYQYATHRPPTVVDENGCDLRELNWLDGYKLEKMGIYLYHYSLLFPKQVLEKCTYYQNASWSKRNKGIEWVEKAYLQLKKPYRVHNVYKFPGWLLNYKGTHPSVIVTLLDDIKNGKIQIDVRNTDDIEFLLKKPFYALGILLLKIIEIFYFPARKFYSKIIIFVSYVQKRNS